jgi:hypothetical protein
MTEDQVKLVQQSFAKVAPISETAAVLFYDRLFEIAPTVRVMFPADMTEQRKKLMAMLAAVVNGLAKRAPSQSATSPTAPSPSTIPSSVRPCCGPWKRDSAMPGHLTSRTPGRRLTARSPAT